jgi:hypothetical protein
MSAKMAKVMRLDKNFLNNSDVLCVRIHQRSSVPVTLRNEE